MSVSTITAADNLPGNITGTANADVLLGAPGAATNPGANNTLDADTISGGGGNDSIYGGGGNDSLFGNDGNDYIFGGNENDTVSGGAGSDTLLGGDGFDLLSFTNASGVTVDLATGIATGEGTDTLVGFEVVQGSSFADTIRASSTGNTLIGGAGADSLVGGAGNDFIEGGAGGDRMFGGGGVDTLSYANAQENINGIEGVYALLDNPAIPNSLLPTSEATGDVTGDFEVLVGSSFRDTLVGSSRADTIFGGDGDDSLIGGVGGDVLIGGNSNDWALGGDDNDTLIGGAGRDFIEGGAGADSLDGGFDPVSDFDRLDYFNSSAAVNVNLATGAASGGDATGDVFVEFEDLGGSTFADTLTGDSAANQIFGQEGNDLIAGGGGGDLLLGGAGSDTLDYSASTSPVTITFDDLDDFTGTGGDAQGDFGSGIEAVIGSSGNDRIVGYVLSTGRNNEFLSGGAGNDTLRGGGGDDTVSGDAGADQLSGGTGFDWLSYANDTAGVTVDLTGNANPQAGGEAAGDTVIGDFEAVRGGSGSDNLRGNNLANTVEGGGGNDTLLGGAGNDVVDGQSNNDRVVWATGDGNDTLLGGAGTDTLTISNWTGPGTGTDSLADGVYGTWTVSGGTGAGATRFFASGSETIRASQFEAITCFARGTRIASARGEVAVEALRLGDLVATGGAQPGLAPVIWLGRVTAEVARHCEPERVAPVLIRGGALGLGVPARDLRVSPDHAIYLDGCLVPARHLVNGTTIVQELWQRRVEYWHVELPAHAVIVSEGALTESYLDDGNRDQFDNGAVMRLFPDFEARRGSGEYDARACAPVVRGGGRLDAIRDRLAALAEGMRRAATG